MMTENNCGKQTGKRYYWLKLQDGFFNSKRIKKLRRLAGGDTYTIIYLKMQLLAIKSGGILRWTGVEDDFASELALDLDETPDNVAVTLQFLLTYGLAETSDNINFFLPYAVENTGSETTAAKRMRDMRERNNAAISSNDVTQPSNRVTQASQCYSDVTPQLRDRYGEIEIEKEKELDREIESEKEKDTFFSQVGGKGESEGKNRAPANSPPPTVENPVDSSIPSDTARRERIAYWKTRVECFARRGYDPTSMYNLAKIQNGITREEIDNYREADA